MVTPPEDVITAIASAGTVSVISSPGAHFPRRSLRAFDARLVWFVGRVIRATRDK